jgi:hypothetical protein
MKEEQEQPLEGLVEPVSEQVGTDSILDLKNGIYNLFVALVNNLMVTKGMVGAVAEACDFLDEISINFKSTIEPEQE